MRGYPCYMQCVATMDKPVTVCSAFTNLGEPVLQYYTWRLKV